MTGDLTAFWNGIENTCAWLVLVGMLAIFLGGVWAIVDTSITYGRNRFIGKRSTPPDDAQLQGCLHEYEPRSFRTPAVKGFFRGDTASLTEIQRHDPRRS